MEEEDMRQRCHTALAEALLVAVKASGKEHDTEALRFVEFARKGLYFGSATSRPVSPEYIGLTMEEFDALKTMAYVGYPKG